MTKRYGTEEASAAPPVLGKERRMFTVPEVRSFDDATRTIIFVASSEAEDRYGDIIRVKGWKTDNYMKNPVFLWGHRSGDPPIGKCVELHMEGGSKPALVQKIEFASKDVYPFADTIYQLYKGKFMNAVSVGFMPLERPKPIMDKDGEETGGYEFSNQELMELSAVPIPANAEALQRAVKAVETGMLRKGDLDFLLKCGDKNPPWSNNVEGVTYSKTPEEDKLKEVPPVVETANAREPREGIKEVLARLVRTEESVEKLDAAVVNNQGLAETMVAVKELSIKLDGLTGAFRQYVDDTVSKAEFEALNPRMEVIRQKIDRLAVSREPGLTDINASLEEVRSKLDQSLIKALQKKDVLDIGVKIDAVKAAVENNNSVVARNATVLDTNQSVTQLRTLVTVRIADKIDDLARQEGIDDLSTAVSLAQTCLIELKSMAETTSEHLEKLAGSDAVEALGKELANYLKELREKISSSLSDMARTSSNVTALCSSVGEFRERFATSLPELAKHSTVQSIVGLVGELRERQTSFMADVAKQSDVVSMNALVGEMRERFSIMVNTVATEATLLELSARVEAVRARQDKMMESMATRSDIEKILERFDDGCRQLTTINQSFNSFKGEVLLHRQQEQGINKQLCPYVDDPIAAKETKWAAVKEMDKQTAPKGWKRMATVIVGDPEKKDSYKLPHHQGSGLKVVPAGVRAALTALESTDMSAADRAGARSHLTKHQKKISAMKGLDFDEQAFMDSLEDLGRGMRSAKENGDAKAALALQACITKLVDELPGVVDPPEKEKREPTEMERIFLGKAAEDDPDDQECDSCGHMKSVHKGDDMMCSAENCTKCEGFKPKSEEMAAKACKTCGHPADVHKDDNGDGDMECSSPNCDCKSYSEPMDASE